MQVSYGDPSVFITSPISLALLIIAAVLLTLVLLPLFRKTREEAFQEEG
jgi:putative tricarboxylic transport membrane protein